MDSPILICNITTSIFSVARHYGGARIHDKTYYYRSERDILVREDWIDVYSKVDWETFVEAVKQGIKPEIPKRQNTKQVINNNIKSLFD